MAEENGDYKGVVSVDPAQQSKADTETLRRFESQLEELAKLGETPVSEYRLSHPFDSHVNGRVQSANFSLNRDEQWKKA